MSATSKSTKSPAFQFYPKDYVSDTNVREMSHKERGIYWDLVCYCWLQGSLPADPMRLAKIVGLPTREFRRHWPAIESCFREAADAKLSHPRLEVERRRQTDRRKKMSDGGKRSAERRAVEAGKVAASTLVQKPNSSSPSSSSTAVVKEREREAGSFDGQAAFMRLVAEYPANRRSDSRITQGKFVHELGNDPSEFSGRFVLMLATLAISKASEQWRNPRFVPNLDTWLTRGDWRGTRKLELAATGTEGKGRTGVTPGKFDNLEERD